MSHAHVSKQGVLGRTVSIVSSFGVQLLDIVELKNSHNLKVKSYVFFVGIFRTSSLGSSISSNLERTVLRR